MKYQVLFICLMLSGTPFSFAQTAKAYEKEGDKAFSQRDFGAALEYYRNALEFDNEKTGLQYKYAEVARLFHAYDFAADYYRAVLESETAADFPLTNYWLGMVKKSMGEYQEAKQYFQSFLAQSSETDGQYIESAKNEIESCIWALGIIKQKDEGITIHHLDKNINTPFSEFGPLLQGDTLYYSSLRYDHPTDKHKPPHKISKVLYSLDGSRGRTLKRRFNETEKHTAHAALTKDGKRIFYTICENKENAEIRCQLYFREMEKHNRWGKPVKLPEEINMPEFTSTHPCIGKNTATGSEILFFVSDRPGGKGKLDIWFCTILPKGKFSEPKNLEQINTIENDITPFFHDASQTLFFSSDGYKTLGGYDIFKSKITNGNWTEPEHTGFPLNSSYNDVYFVLNNDSTLAYLSSNRLGSMYLDENNKSCCNDIYKVTFAKRDTTKLTPPPGDSLTYVYDPADPIPPVTETEEDTPPTNLEDFLPLALYFDNDEPDKRTRRTTTKKSYGETYDKYIKRQNIFVEEFLKEIPESEQEEVEYDINDFFVRKVKRGFDYLDLFSNILLERLREGEKIEIFVKGFTSPRAKSDYNIQLGKRRISSVKNHFETYNNKVFKPFIESGQLIISERSFGETTVPEGVSDDLDDVRLSIYSVEASIERRVEIVEIKRN